MVTRPPLGAPGVPLPAFLFWLSAVTVPTALMPVVLLSIWLLSALMVAPATEALSPAPLLWAITLRETLRAELAAEALKPSPVFSEAMQSSTVPKPLVLVSIPVPFFSRRVFRTEATPNPPVAETKIPLAHS